MYVSFKIKGVIIKGRICITDEKVVFKKFIFTCFEERIDKMSCLKDGTFKLRHLFSCFERPCITFRTKRDRDRNVIIFKNKNDMEQFRNEFENHKDTLLKNNKEKYKPKVDEEKNNITIENKNTIDFLISESMILYGGDKTHKFEKALTAAKKGNTEAQFVVGAMLDSEGKYQQAVLWYELAAKSHFAAAENSLGSCYHKGEGVERDIKRAMYWYRQAADQNDIQAIMNLAMIYEKGCDEIQPDDRMASYWYLKGAKAGDKIAQNNLAYNYIHGLGVPQDYEQGVFWYKKSALQGFPGAINWCKNNGVDISI